jgi:hypothetical protein
LRCSETEDPPRAGLELRSPGQIDAVLARVVAARAVIRLAQAVFGGGYTAYVADPSREDGRLALPD